MGLPTVIAFSAFAASRNEPVVGIVGGALMYGISHLMFFVGVTMAGTKYVLAMNRWLARITLEKILGSEAKTYCALPYGESVRERLKN
jgi:predicted Na+-dependent transporter